MRRSAFRLVPHSGGVDALLLMAHPRRSAKKMSPAREYLVPFVCALLACPAFVFLHELAHYVAGACLGFGGKLHYAQVTGIRLTWQADALVTAAGPLLQAGLAVAGFVWLRNLRTGRREAAPTLGDWLATTLALNAGRWLRGLTGPPSHPQPPDEALLSRAIGLPAWFLPYLLAVMAILALLGILRLLPPGGRLLPFLAMGLGGAIGIQLWMSVLGPFLLP